MKYWLSLIVLLVLLVPGASAEFSEDWVLVDDCEYLTAAESSGVMIVGTDSSGDLRDKYGAYTAANAFDCDPATTWAENRSGQGEGAWLKGEWEVLSDRWSVMGVMLRSGYHKSSDVFKKNSRPMTVELEIASGGASADYLVTLEDRLSCQYIVFDAPIAIEGSVSAKLTVWEVYPGSKYSDTCVSEFDLLVSPEKGDETSGQPIGGDAAGWFLEDAGETEEEESLFILFYRIKGEDYTGYSAGNSERKNACGSVDGVDVGISAIYTMRDEQTARSLLQGILNDSWEIDDGLEEIQQLLDRAVSVRLTQSELYASEISGNSPLDNPPRNADEYYRFALVTAEGDTVSLLANTGYETDGGEWAEAVIIP